MKHIHHIKAQAENLPESFVVKATGRYYTHDAVAKQMIARAISSQSKKLDNRKIMRVVDPFGGDGRLVVEFIRHWINARQPCAEWRVTLWDLNEEGLKEAESSLSQLASETGSKISWQLVVGDAFHLATADAEKFDIVISNPPWEQLKPDHRELKSLSGDLAKSYVDSMRNYDHFLSGEYPIAQPSRKFAGWGTNLSRVGFEVCRRLLNDDGVMAIVMPASFMADDLSIGLRREVIDECLVHEIAYFPAEARLFGTADVAAITLVLERCEVKRFSPILTRFDKHLNIESSCRIQLSRSFLSSSGFVIPVSVGGKAIAILKRITENLPSWHDLEQCEISHLWAGREIDETGSNKWLHEDANGPLFIKGRMIDRFQIRTPPTLRVGKDGWIPSSSMQFQRIVWRDVSRPNQKRRVIATIVPAGFAAGNSLGVAYFTDNNEGALLVLLGIMSSAVFEFQLRSHLATGHVSLSSLRKVRVPPMSRLCHLTDVREEVSKLLSNPAHPQARLEAVVAKHAYGLSQEELSGILETFAKLTVEEREEILDEYRALDFAPASTVPARFSKHNHAADAIIPNHRTANLSRLDLEMVRSVPEGGNWKNIPESIPSKRLEQIRASFKRGEGSRSTYYGRLRGSMPSYTINTYFNRPGNGCHMHPFQNRVLSQREAARLQSFPDQFVFVGPQGSVNTQIGNAVPPLLAYQIAKQLGKPGVFVDLFSGAGGLGLGFKWAGWKPLVANDVEPRFLETYKANVHSAVVLGSITERHIQQEIISRTARLRAQNPEAPLWILGGPPCQGFSTAGLKRTMDDSRNQLFWEYLTVLEALRPDGFVFENVTGLLNMQKGKVFEVVKDAFKSAMPKVDGWLLSAEEFAIPQRRKRVFLVGTSDKNHVIDPPKVITSSSPNGELFGESDIAISVNEAISDLPALEPGQDGSSLAYRSKPESAYQALMRGKIEPSEFLSLVRSGRRNKEADRSDYLVGQEA